MDVVLVIDFYQKFIIFPTPTPDGNDVDFLKCLLDDIELMQFTGLQDIYGQDIYEGDLFKAPIFGETGYILLQIVFNRGAFKIQATSCKTISIASLGDYIDAPPNAVKIIGNIWENHELLEQK